MSGETEFQRMLKACENPKTEVRFKFKDGDWELATGPEFLAKFHKNQSGHVSIDWVVEKRPPTNGHGA